MIDILENHLRNTMPVDQVEECIYASTLLECLGVEMDEAHVSMAMDYANGTIENLTNVYYDSLFNDIHSVFRNHNIGVSTESSISQILPILEFLVNIENSELIQEVSDAAKSDQFDNAERFALCVSIVTARTVEEILPHLMEVPFSVILSIQLYTSERLSTADKENDNTAENSLAYIKALTAYAQLVNGTQMKCYEYATTDGVVIGLPMDFYWQMYKDYLTSIPLQAMVYELIGFCIISDRHDSEPSTVILPIVNEYYGDDIEQSSKVSVLIRQTLLNLQTSANSGLFQKVGVI